MTTEKSQFINKLKTETKDLTLSYIRICKQLPKSQDNYIISNQLIRSVTSVASNYRSSCMSRSEKEFFSKLSIVIEEIDETAFWLELLLELHNEDVELELEKYMDKSIELRMIFSKARISLYYKRYPKK